MLRGRSRGIPVEASSPLRCVTFEKPYESSWKRQLILFSKRESRVPSQPFFFPPSVASKVRLSLPSSNEEKNIGMTDDNLSFNYEVNGHSVIDVMTN